MKNNTKSQWKINEFIIKLSKSAYMFLIIGYLLILTLLIVLITPKYSYIVIPQYEHVVYNEDIFPQITLVGLRSFDENDKMTTRYSVQAKLSGRLNEDNNDSKLDILRFQMSAFLTTNKMYYFTEHTNRQTPISHTYTMSSTDTEKNIPDEFFIKLRYKDSSGQEKAASFLEDVMLERPAGNYTSNTKIFSTTSPDNADLELRYRVTQNDTAYQTSVSIIVRDQTEKFHVDMQSWIYTEAGEYLPFIGVYGYSDQKYNYTLSNREVNLKLEPQEIHTYLSYYVEGDNGVVDKKTLLHKASFESLLGNDPITPDEPSIPDANSSNWIPWTVGAFVLVGSGLGASYIFLKKRKENTN
ncbi:MAG: hypothetical protein WC008_02930 [Bacilli bacterium]